MKKKLAPDQTAVNGEREFKIPEFIVDTSSTLPAVSYVGLSFHQVTILDFLGRDKRGNNYWKALCQCGTVFSIAGRNVKHQSQQSCGCVRREFARNLFLGKRKEETTQYKPAGINQVKGIFGSYLKSARRRNLVFELTIEQFTELTKQPCFYCGDSLVNSKKGKYGKYRYNGVDRIDNTKGYTISNSVACCKHCNIAKGRQSQEDFLNMCRKIVNRFPSTSTNSSTPSLLDK